MEAWVDPEVDPESLVIGTILTPGQERDTIRKRVLPQLAGQEEMQWPFTRRSTDPFPMSSVRYPTPLGRSKRAGPAALSRA